MISATRPRLWTALTLTAAVPRVLAAFLLPNAFGDAYAYIREVEALSAKLSSGTFHLTDLYGFWLPLYQFICAALVVLFGHPFYVSKLVSALCGVGICLLVYDITYRLTNHHKAALLTFALVALSPLHIFNSASSMTDIPHAFFVLGGVFFVQRRKWIAAAILIALAGLTRVDSWMLIPLVPALQFFMGRRVSLVACAILIFPPLFWFYISWKATGDWMACFVARKAYMDWLLSVNPSLASFSLAGVARDVGALLLSTDMAVLAACLTAGWLIFKRRKSGRELREVLPVSLFFYAFLGFIVLAYLTHKQPIIFPRYGLLLFALGAPLLPWTFLQLMRLKPLQTRRLLYAIVAVSLFNACVQLAYSAGYIKREYTYGSVASSLREQFRPGTRIFSDDGTVPALSLIAPENFRSSTDAPRDRAGFLSYLKEQEIEYLVFIDRPDSTPAQLFPELRDGAGNEMFEQVMHASSKFLPADVRLYRVKQ
ncbi:MAG: glycosyltransferase family 39 protein [Acidobacteria bacterium]|nr:glycosyltransferase family 39 protein [Acidobacteriota bacterium]